MVAAAGVRDQRRPRAVHVGLDDHAARRRAHDENLVSNAQAIPVAFGVHGDTRGVSWLPVYHDMGLIGHVVVTTSHLVPNVFMSPLSFLARPMRWLRAISAHRATASGGPSFAYDLRPALLGGSHDGR